MDPLMSSSGLDRFRGNTNSHEISATAASDTAHIANNHAYAVTINNNNPDLSSAAVASPRQQQQQLLRRGVVSACVVREQDQYMPIANVIRIMRRILPPHAKISDDAKETVQECVSEYISFITGEANERCQREQRKTVTAEDVLFAMSKLGFDNYVEPLSVFLRKYREAEGTDRMASSLFAKREKGDHVGMISMEYAHGAIPPGHYGGPPTGHYGGPPTGYAMSVPQSGMYHEGTMGGYYRDGGVNGGGSSSSPRGQPQGALGGGGFDPFAQFK